MPAALLHGRGRSSALRGRRAGGRGFRPGIGLGIAWRNLLFCQLSRKVNSARRAGHSITTSARPASTEAPTVTATSLTRPVFGERNSFSIFMASTTMTGWRAST